MSKETGGPAFPQIYQTCQPYMVGMTLRDYFAGQALASVLGASSRQEPKPQTIARVCYLVADAMLEARK